MALFKPEFGLIFWMFLVFLVILGILAKYAWPVIIRSIEERAEFIDSGVKYTQEAVRKLDEVQAESRVLLEDAHKKQIEVLQETERIRQEIIETARKDAGVEARKVMDNAQLAIEQSKREAEMQMRKQVSHLALDIAGKLLRKDLSDNAGQSALVNKLLDEIKE